MQSRYIDKCRQGRSLVEAKLGSGPPCLVKFCMSVSSWTLAAHMHDRIQHSNSCTPLLIKLILSGWMLVALVYTVKNFLHELLYRCLCWYYELAPLVFCTLRHCRRRIQGPRGGSRRMQGRWRAQMSSTSRCESGDPCNGRWWSLPFSLSSLLVAAGRRTHRRFGIERSSLSSGHAALH